MVLFRAMWQQNYTPIGNSLVLSALVAAVPIFVLLFLIGIRRKPAWIASLAGLGTVVVLAAVVYGMPMGMLFSSITYGAAFGLFPIGWVVFSAILLYRVMQESGKFDILKDSVGHLTDDGRLQMMLVAFAFGAFIEGCAGFGTPVAVAATMLTGLGFTPFLAAAVCLLANTAPVAFGSIATPILTLARTTGLPLDRLSAGVGRICAPVSLFIPAYMIAVMCGWAGLRGVLPAAAVCGIAFAGTQFVVSNFIGPELTDVLASMAAMGALFVLIQSMEAARQIRLRTYASGKVSPQHAQRRAGLGAVHDSGRAGSAVGISAVQSEAGLRSRCRSTGPDCITWFNRCRPLSHSHRSMARYSISSGCPLQEPHVCSLRYSAPWSLALAVAVLRGLRKDRASNSLLAELTLAAVLALAYVMNYSGATGTLGLAFAATGVLFPDVQFCSWLSGSFSDRQRHLRQRAFRHTSGSDGQQAGHESGSDGGGQLGRRRDGKDDQPDQHRRSRSRNVDETRRRRTAIRLHTEAQHLPDAGHRPAS